VDFTLFAVSPLVPDPGIRQPAVHTPVLNKRLHFAYNNQNDYLKVTTITSE